MEKREERKTGAKNFLFTIFSSALSVFEAVNYVRCAFMWNFVVNFNSSLRKKGENEAKA